MPTQEIHPGSAWAEFRNRTTIGCNCHLRASTHFCIFFCRSSQFTSTTLEEVSSVSAINANALLSLCFRSAFALLSLCFRSAFAVLSLCFRSAFALLSLCFRSASALLSLCCRFAFALLSLCFRFAFALFSLCFRSAFALLSLCFCFAFALFSLCFRSTFALLSLCFRSAFATRLLFLLSQSSTCPRATGARSDCNVNVFRLFFLFLAHYKHLLKKNRIPPGKNPARRNARSD